MANIDEPQDDQTPDDPEPRAAGLPTRGGRTAPGSQPAGFEPFEPIARPKAASPAAAKARVPTRAPAPALSAAELAAKREARGGRGYATARAADPGRTGTAAASTAPEPQPQTEPGPEPEVAVAVLPSTRRLKPAVLIAIAACAVLVVAGAAVVLGGGDDEEAPGASSTTSAGAPESLEFQPPVRLTSNTEHVETEVLADGNLVVTHWIRSSAPMTQLDISVPVTPDLDEQPAEVSDLVVAADGVRLDVADTLADDTTPTGLPEARDLYVQYHLAGTLERSGSAEGRALATMTSLSVRADPDVISRTQVFPGSQVLSVACLAPGPTSLPRPCGSIDEGEWTVLLPADALDDTVIVQFDLDA